MKSQKNASKTPTTAEQCFTNFWPNIRGEIEQLDPAKPCHSGLPLARIKKIMKLDEEVPLVAHSAITVLAKATEIFIQDLTLQSCLQKQASNRITLYRQDIAKATSKCEYFDFLVDIVPRNVKLPRRKEPATEPKSPDWDSNDEEGCSSCAAGNCEEARCTFQPEKPSRYVALAAATTECQTNDDMVAQVVPIVVPSSGTIPNNEAESGTQTLQLFLQIVTPTGEIQHVPMMIPQDNLTITEVIDPDATPSFV